MKPLVLWCRWHDASLRLHGRDEGFLWGELAFPDETKPFRYNRETQELTIGRDEDARRVLLDEMGVEIEEENP